ncbi:MAG: DUF6516 family protein [bacterium]|nr:DUF6516 family protein [bacterium]
MSGTRLSSFPHHKHIGSEVIENSEPTLRDVLHEIETILVTF